MVGRKEAVVVLLVVVAATCLRLSRYHFHHCDLRVNSIFLMGERES